MKCGKAIEWEAARKYNRVVQCGMQARSLAHYKEAIGMVRKGAIGKVYMAKGLCYKRRKSIGPQPDSQAPPTMDFDTWLGPAPMRPFNANRFHYNWHWFWDTGNGDIANQGVHEMDISRWGLGKATMPREIFSTGAEYIYEDDQQTPNTQLSVMRWDDCQLLFEVRGIYTGGENATQPEGTYFIGVTFFGSEGVPLPSLEHSYRTGRALRCDAAGNIEGDAEASAMLTRQYRAPFVVPAHV